MARRKKLYITEIEKHFKKKEFSTGELYSFYKLLEPEIPKKTVSWRLYELTKLGILARTGMGTYQLSDKVLFLPEITDEIQIIYNEIRDQFPFVNLCVWNTRLLNEFMVHQPAKFMTFIETETEVAESLFFFLKEKYKNLFLNPDENTIEKYIVGENNTILIKPLISEAPVITVKDVDTTSLEKMLVDIYCEDKFFFAFQGAEMTNIYENSIATYQINSSKLLRYAARRGKRKEIEKLLS